MSTESTSSISTVPKRLSREDEAKLALEYTQVTPGTAWALMIAFLLTIVAVPVAQHVVEIRANLQARREERAATGEPPAGRILPQSWDVFPLLWPSRGEALPTVEEISEYETALEEGSIVSSWILPRAQTVLSRIGAGNEQVYPGRGGWLHYRPDVDYVTSRGFLDATLLVQRQRAGDESVAEVQPDPVRPLVRFKDQLAQRGILLVVVPTPVKPMLHPETLAAHYDAAGGVPTAPLQNPSWAAFVRTMERESVLVFDPTPVLTGAWRRTGQPQYLRTDTHWTPDAMERVAGALADFLRARVPELPLPQQHGDAPAAAAYTRRARDIENNGDIADMLKLPPRTLREVAGPPQRVRIHPVRTSGGGQRWRPDRRADVLLLGDSFSNIYSLGGMGWGEGAGFAEQLSFALQRPLDRIVINAGGSYTTRQRLRAELLQGKDRLAGKRVVIYQFAMRDLLIGDWKQLDLPPPPRLSKGTGTP